MTKTRRPTVMLTERQHEAAKLAARGRTVEEIAGELGITASTAKQHLARARQLLGVERKRDLIAALEATKVEVIA